MASEKQKRRYELRQRAATMAETRRRIAAAAVELHGTIGPAHTTLSAIAAHAGVRRPTLYRHFPTEADLFEACSAHWAAANPWPDPERWAAIADPAERLRAALDELYAYHEHTEGMQANVRRDIGGVAVIPSAQQAFMAAMARSEQVVASAWPETANARLLAGAVRHALDFGTWQSLRRAGELSHADAVDLMAGLVERAATR